MAHPTTRRSSPIFNTLLGTRRAGLLATQAIRFQRNRRVLARIKETGDIFNAFSDRDWVLDGANVRISVVCFDNGSDGERTLDGEQVECIYVDLTAYSNATTPTDLTSAQRLRENTGICFAGETKHGPFEISRVLAEAMLERPNPHGKPNSDVVRPWMVGRDINQRSRDMWIIDFGHDVPESDAALYEEPFEYVRSVVKPERDKHRETKLREQWWLHGRPRVEMREALGGLTRFIGTSEVSKHRMFSYIDGSVLPNKTIVVFAREDEYFFGILQSRMHVLWTLAMGTQLESRPRYIISACFETFPFPHPIEEQREAIGAIAAELNQLREGWLNPEGVSAAELKRRTLTNLYNQRPTWLDNIHARLDAAVADAYGWPADLADGEILERLLALNLERAGEEG